MEQAVEEGACLLVGKEQGQDEEQEGGKAPELGRVLAQG